MTGNAAINDPNAGAENPAIDASRNKILDGRQRRPPPPCLTTIRSGLHPVDAHWPEIARHLERDGVVRLVSDRVCNDAELLRLAQLLGRPQRETHPAVREFVHHGTILDLRAIWRDADDVHRRPFSLSALRMHTESSLAPRPRQPAFLILECLANGALQHGAQTLLVDQASVLNTLTSKARTTLGSVRIAGAHDEVLRSDSGRDVLAFRDFGPSPGRAVAAAHEDAMDRVVCADQLALDAYNELLAALYADQHVFGLSWRAGDLVIIDNRRWFHGRSAGVERAGGGRRHLRRIRVLVS